MVAVPTGIKIFNWLGTMYGGRIRFDLPMLFCIAFLFQFLVAGLTGVMLAVAPLNWQLTDSYFVVAHFHLIMGVAAVFGIFVVLLYRYFGFAELRKQAFPLVYLAFAIPLPSWAIDNVTRPLQTLVSWASAHITAFAGYPVARQGVSLFVAQYQLLVEDACSGLNSLVGLIAI